MDSPNIFLEWQSAEYTDKDGNTSEFEIQNFSGMPQTEGYYTFSYPMENIQMGDFAAFNLAGCSAEIYFDDKLVYSCVCVPQSESINMNNIELPFPYGAVSCNIKMIFRCLDVQSVGIFPPMLKVSSEFIRNRFTVASTNYFTIPTGILAFIFIILCGLFLLGVVMGKTDISLIFIAIAAGSLTVYNMALGSGYYFLPEWLHHLFINSGLKYIAPISIAIYFILNRQKKLFKYYIYISIVLVAVFGAVYFISALNHGGMFKMVNGIIDSLLSAGAYMSIIHWLTFLIIAAFAIAALLYHIFSFIGIEAEANMLKMQNSIAKKSYDTILRSFRQTSGLRHRWKSDIIALYLLYKQNKTAEIGEYLDKLLGNTVNMPRVEYSNNYTVNSIVQYTVAEAAASDVKLTADVSVSEKLNIPDEDLCILLVNMLDNAIEAAKDTDANREKFIELRIKQEKLFLSIKCSNSCPSRSKNTNGFMGTTKRDKLNHGFGLRQMEGIAKKYNSILDITTEGGIFTVQTTLSLLHTDKSS